MIDLADQSFQNFEKINLVVKSVCINKSFIEAVSTGNSTIIKIENRVKER